MAAGDAVVDGKPVATIIKVEAKGEFIEASQEKPFVVSKESLKGVKERQDLFTYRTRFLIDGAVVKGFPALRKLGALSCLVVKPEGKTKAETSAVSIEDLLD